MQIVTTESGSRYRYSGRTMTLIPEEGGVEGMSWVFWGTPTPGKRMWLVRGTIDGKRVGFRETTPVVTVEDA